MPAMFRNPFRKLAPIQESPNEDIVTEDIGPDPQLPLPTTNDESRSPQDRLKAYMSTILPPLMQRHLLVTKPGRATDQIVEGSNVQQVTVFEGRFGTLLRVKFENGIWWEVYCEMESVANEAARAWHPAWQVLPVTAVEEDAASVYSQPGLEMNEERAAVPEDAESVYSQPGLEDTRTDADSIYIQLGMEDTATANECTSEDTAVNTIADEEESRSTSNPQLTIEPPSTSRTTTWLNTLLPPHGPTLLDTYTLHRQLFLSDLATFYNPTILLQSLLQPYLKTHTSLPCIPDLHPSQSWLDQIPEIVGGKPSAWHPAGQTWVVQNFKFGVPVYLDRHRGKDRICLNVNGKKEILKGRKRERFLDDLARIQASYATLTDSHLGELELFPTSDVDPTAFPLDDRLGVSVSVKANGRFSSPYEFFTQYIPDDTNPFLQSLIRQAISQIDYAPGPYPLQPIRPLHGNICVCPKSGSITRFDRSHHVASIPWELASHAPLTLTPRERKKWMYSMKRHCLGCAIRKGGEVSGEERLVWREGKGGEVVDLVLEWRRMVLGEVECDEDGARGFERRLVWLLYGRKDWKVFKQEWKANLTIGNVMSCK